jgi:sugar/nucleoside kinase (ribokinase family)
MLSTVSEGPILCLGEAIVDLVCEREVESIEEADGLVPYFGGALANVAVAAARAGASAALAGGVGADPWGEWLAARLAAEGVDLTWLSHVEGIQTPVAFVTFDARREPTFEIYGDGLAAGMHSLDGRVDEAVDSAAAVVFGSNTLVGPVERELTMSARTRALEAGVPVLFDPNVRPNRWDDLATVAELSRRLAADAAVLRVNLDEARLLAGADAGSNPEELAEALLRLGPRLVVITLGEDGALVRGEARGSAQAGGVEVVSPMGAGDAFMGAFAAALAERNWDLSSADEALAPAVAAGSAACAHWGAIG